MISNWLESECFLNFRKLWHFLELAPFSIPSYYQSGLLPLLCFDIPYTHFTPIPYLNLRVLFSPKILFHCLLSPSISLFLSICMKLFSSSFSSPLFWESWTSRLTQPFTTQLQLSHGPAVPTTPFTPENTAYMVCTPWIWFVFKRSLK